MRQSASYLLNLIKVKMKHLNEVSEIIPTDIIKEFNRQFKNYEMSRPEIIMSLHPIELYKETLLEEGTINYNDKIKLYKKINNEKETEEEKKTKVSVALDRELLTYYRGLHINLSSLVNKLLKDYIESRV
jgi:hypothetical protein